MSIVIAVILLILVFENTMIMFMMATLVSEGKKDADRVIDKLKRLYGVTVEYLKTV